MGRRGREGRWWAAGIEPSRYRPLMPCPFCQLRRRQSPGSVGSSGRPHQRPSRRQDRGSRGVAQQCMTQSSVGSSLTCFNSDALVDFLEADVRSSRICRSEELPAAQCWGSRQPAKADRQELGRDQEGAWIGRLLLRGGFPGSVRFGLALSSLPCSGLGGHGVGWQLPTLVLEVLQPKGSNMLFWPA